jgi:hypothetical protein
MLAGGLTDVPMAPLSHRQNWFLSDSSPIAAMKVVQTHLAMVNLSSSGSHVVEPERWSRDGMMVTL